MLLEPFGHIEDLRKYRAFFKIQLPDIVLEYLEIFFGKLGSMLGIEFGIRIPTYAAGYDESTWPAFRAFEAMRRLQIAKRIHFHRALKYPDEPPYHLVTVELVGRQRLGYVGIGRNLFDKNAAVWPAVGEAIERWALDHFIPHDKEIILASQKTLSGKSVVDLRDVAGFSNELREKGHPAYELKFDDDSLFKWIRAYSLTRDEEILAPLQWFSFHYTGEVMETNREPLLSPPVTTGAATGGNIEEAVLKGILEVVERDAFMIYWLNKITPVQIDLTGTRDPKLKRTLAIARKYKLELYFLYLQTDVPVHTVLSVVVDRTGHGAAMTTNASTKFDLKDAIHSSLEGSLGIRGILRDPQRSMEDFSDPNKLDHMGRMLYWSQPKHLSEAEFFLQGKRESLETFPLYEARSSADHLRELLSFFRAQDTEVLYREILPKQIKKALEGLTVVMVRIPTFQPLHLSENMPAFAGNRLRDVPKKLGLATSASVNTLPHPFS